MGIAMSHMASQRVALKAGFYPAWAELSCKGKVWNNGFIYLSYPINKSNNIRSKVIMATKDMKPPIAIIYIGIYRSSFS